MRNSKSCLKILVFTMLATVILIACTLPTGRTSVFSETSSPPTVQLTREGGLAPSLLGEWTTGEVHDMAWSPDNRIFVVNYSWVEGNDLNRVVQAFAVESLKSAWIAKNSLAMDLVFSPDGQFIVESNVFAPFFYWRSIEQGKVVREGELTDISQIKPGDCNGGGQVIIANARENIALIADYNNLIGLNAQNTVIIRQLDLESGKCKNLIAYKGSFDLFDLNSSETRLAYGGEGKDDSVILWDMEKREEICHIPKVDFGRFVPGESILAVIRGQKIIFVDDSTCQELRELALSPARENYDTYLTFSPDGQQLAIARDSIQIMNISTGEILAQMPFPENASPYPVKLFLGGMSFSPNGHYLLIAYASLKDAYSAKVQLWRLLQ